jgi:preprotein translocase SecE subunit
MINTLALITIFFISLSLIICYILQKLFFDLLYFMESLNLLIIDNTFFISYILSITITLIIFYYLFFINKKIKNLVIKCIIELYKVFWPTFIETIESTTLVIITTTISAIVLFFFDILFSWLISNNFFII